MSSRNKCLLPRATLHSDSEQEQSLYVLPISFLLVHIFYMRVSARARHQCGFPLVHLLGDLLYLIRFALMSGFNSLRRSRWFFSQSILPIRAPLSSSSFAVFILVNLEIP